MHNQMIEKELKALREGARQGQGPNGLMAVEEFERLLLAIPFQEKKISNPDRVMLKQAGFMPPRASGGSDKPMAFMQNQPRNANLTRAEKQLVSLQAQEFDGFKVLETFNQDPNHKQDLLF